MHPPNYFLADLPPEAGFSATMIREACQTLKRNRERFLAHRSTQSLVNLLATVAKNWLDPSYPLRKLTLEQGPAAMGFSRQTLTRGLESFFRELTPEAFQALLEQELGHAERLDGFCAASLETRAGRAAVARAPELLVHVTAGNVPNAALLSVVLGVLVRSAQFVKCASGTSLVPRYFAHSLYEAEPKLGACIEVAEWQGGNTAFESILFEEADCVTATGADETLAAIRQRLPATARFVGYGHRVSFAYIAAEVLSGANLRGLLQQAVDDVVSWNQLGCLSPHVFYVEDGGLVSPEKFAEMLAEALAEREHSEPRGDVPPETAATIASRRAIYELRAAHNPGTRLWHSQGSSAWSVVYEADTPFQLSCLHRFVYVQGVGNLTEALRNADPIRSKVSTVGMAVPEHKAQECASQLAGWGVPRVCALGRMQNPPLCWRHDGRPLLGGWVAWTDWEQKKG